ncbi:hypothetical protein HMPREF9126_1018 [Parvimonas sp. oral taxon 110 str. F0139]|nr:hypothetical protein HMPREF9126_1018 [Parvimonas sp. oral taxon 110 str. F0139]
MFLFSLISPKLKTGQMLRSYPKFAEGSSKIKTFGFIA